MGAAPGAADAAGRGGGGRLPRRLVHLYVGLLLYGLSAALLVRADLGLSPWDVLHQGVARRTGLTIGTVSVAVGACTLLLWWPLRERPGLGTVSNALLIGTTMDAVLAVLPPVHGLAAQLAVAVFAVALNGVATGLYLSARFGSGPRDGLMTGLHRAVGLPLRVARTMVEASVLVAGVLLGGTAGVGTVLYAVAIGPLAQLFLRVFRIAEGPAAPAGGDAVPERI